MFIYNHFIDRFNQYEMLYGDVVLGGPRTSQYSPSVGEGHFLIYLFPEAGTILTFYVDARN